MTHLIIQHDTTSRNAYLLDFLNKTLDKQYVTVTELLNIPDMHILEKLESQQIGIDDVKLLIKEMIYHPYELSYQVAIIFHSQNLTTEAQNALLKNLEEQSDSTLYILLVDNEKHLLDTIVSRCTRHYVKIAQSNNVSQNAPVVSDVNLIQEFLKKDLLEKFLFIKELEDIEKENGGAISNFLFELEQYFMNELEKAISEQNANSATTIKIKIDYIIKTSQKLRANANKRLTLENLALQL